MRCYVNLTKISLLSSFHKLAKIGNNGNIDIRDFTEQNNKTKIHLQNVTPVSIEPRTSATWI